MDIGSTPFSLSLTTLATPKSEIFAPNSSSSSRLFDFTSLCTIGGSQSWCKYESPSAAPKTILNLVGQSKSPLLLPCSKSLKLPFGMYSYTKSLLPPASQQHHNFTIFLCLIFPNFFHGDGLPTAQNDFVDFTRGSSANHVRLLEAAANFELAKTELVERGPLSYGNYSFGRLLQFPVPQQKPNDPDKENEAHCDENGPQHPRKNPIRFLLFAIA
ncbi:ribosomal protein S4 (RPS4A) family protein [Striga asiatica]|uniref:Ribosomal protein S4 (RPS4A) family protein n=1 Tax=Striga asiatica TaxID=4170 RepID=A0A5A7R779_STRAF|nr:ribosomal protein S4 (RPS4A) family protein [Striga asiatica]